MSKWRTHRTHSFNTKPQYSWGTLRNGRKNSAHILTTNGLADHEVAAENLRSKIVQGSGVFRPLPRK